MTPVRRLVRIAALVLVPLALAAPAGAQQPPSGVQTNPPVVPPPQPPPPPAATTVQPAQGCQTQWGICRVACCIAPGTPCYCAGPNNTPLPGYAVEFFRPTR